MPDGIRVSVCMATYNGATYIREQLDSILSELDIDDEVVVVDDASTDGTVNIVRAIGDRRIRVFDRAENLGYVRTFEESLLRSRGEYLLLSDQDDVWLPGRVGTMLDVLRTETVVASNMVILGTGERPNWWMPARTARQWYRNLLRIVAGVSGYYGCGMGLRRDALRVLTPFPAFLTESHDLWMALGGNLLHSVGLVEAPTLQRRVHGENVTPLRPRSVGKVLAARIMLLRALFVLARRIRRLRSVQTS
nr:glycosyltransferase [Planctomonas sp. JC2975]